MKKVHFYLLFLFISVSLYSQHSYVIQDFGIWTGILVEKDLSKDLKFEVEQQIRLHTNATKFDDYLVDIGGKYTLNKNFKLGGSLRYTYNSRRIKESENNYRYNLDLNYKRKVSPKFKLYYRLRYQKEYTNIFQSPSVYSSAVRNKIKVRYSYNQNHEFYVSGELFRQIEKFRDPYFNSLRFYIGDILYTKIGDFDCSFGYQQKINTNNPSAFYFIKTIYKLQL